MQHAETEICSTPQNSAGLRVLVCSERVWKMNQFPKGRLCVFLLSAFGLGTHTHTHTISRNRSHTQTSWWFSLSAGRRLWSGPRDQEGSLWGGDEICTALRQWQRHPQIRDVCSNSAAEPRVRKLQVDLKVQHASPCECGLDMFKHRPFFFLPAGFLQKDGGLVLDQEGKTCTEMKAMMISISDRNV